MTIPLQFRPGAAGLDHRSSRGRQRLLVWLLPACLATFRVEATSLPFEPAAAFANVPPGTLPVRYGQRVAGPSQDGFAHGEAGGFTPDVQVTFSTRRLEVDRPGRAETFGLRVGSGGWNHGTGETALEVLQGDTAQGQELRIRLRGSDAAWPALRGFDLVGRDGVPATVAFVAVSDGVLSTLHVSTNLAIPGTGALNLRFDPPLVAEQVHITVGLGAQPPGVGLDNLEFGQQAVVPAVWRFETLQVHPGNTSCRDLPEVAGLAVDPQGRPVVAWSEQNGCGGAGSGWWARREDGEWRVHQITASPFPADFSRYSPNGGLGLTLSSNAVPFLFHPVANFGWDVPYMLARVNLDETPNGPGVVVHGFGGGRSPDLAFGVAAEASAVPDIVTHILGGAVRMWGTTPVSPEGRHLLGELVYRHGPARETHLLYQRDADLVYNPGSAAQERAVLRINAGASPHAMAIDAANGIHIAAAQGEGLSYYGAMGRLAYVYSPDGVNWSTQLLGPAEVGATAVALDSQGLPAIAFLRNFQWLYLTRLTADGWTRPVLLRSGLGGWDFSRTVRLAFDSQDVPHIAVYDDLTRRTLVVSPVPGVIPADLAVMVQASTNRVAVGVTNTIVVTAANHGARNASTASVVVTLPPELVVRDVQPRPARSEGARYTFELGTLQAFESRDLVFRAAALDPVRVCVQASIQSDTPDPDASNNLVSGCVAEALPAPCLGAAPPADCGAVTLLPERLPPAVAGQAWAVDLRTPRAGPGATLRVNPASLPPDFCLTADAQLRGVAGVPGEWSLTFESVEANGLVRTFTRTLRIQPEEWPAGLVGFWPLDGHGQDLAGTSPGAIGGRTVFVPGPGGLAAQTARDILEDPRGDLREPPPVLATAGPLEGMAFGERPFTIAGWFRRDGLARSRGDPAPRGAVISLTAGDTWNRERHLAFNAANGRLEVLDGPPDGRANLLSGPVVPAGEWHHLALVSEGRQGRLYVNGTLGGERVFPAAPAERLALSVGSWANGANYSGAVDEVVLFDRALGAAEIAALRDELLPRRLPLPPGAVFPIAPAVHELPLPDAVENHPYHAALATAFCGSPTRLALIEGTWPAGVTMASNGEVSGTPATPGGYAVRVRAWDAAENAAELLVRLTVRAGPPMLGREPGDQAVDLGGLLVLLAETRQPAALQWYFNGEPLAGATQPLLTVTSFSREQAGVYQLRAENEAGVAWSREATVQLTVPVAAQTGVGLSDLALRADGLIRLRVATVPGRVYELQRALDLALPVERRWQPVQRFVAAAETIELQDVVAGRPRAAYYRVVEQPTSPPAAFSLADDSRFVGVAEDGRPRPGLLPYQDPASGRLGPFELRFGGNEVPADAGLCLGLSQGAQPVTGPDGTTQLQFDRGELFFGEESPIQFDEDGSNRLVIASAGGVLLPAGPPTVADLERLLGREPGSGVRVTVYRQFRFRLLRGTFEGPRIRQARLAWLDSGTLRAPTPAETADLPDFDLELTASRMRLAFTGEFTLPDDTGSPARLVVPPNRPLWLELGPGGRLHLGGTAALRFAEGPSLTVDVLAAPPDYRLTIRADDIRVPETLALADLLPGPPEFSPPVAGARPALHNADPEEEILRAVLRNAEYASCASKALLRRVADREGAASGSPATPPEEGDFVSEKLDLFEFWRCVVMKHGYDNWPGAEIVPHQLMVEIERLLANPPTDFGGLVDRGGGFAFEFHARLVAELGGLALQVPNHPELAHRAYDAYLLLRKVADEGDCENWDPSSIRRGLEALMQVRVLDPDEQIFPAGTWRDFEVWTARILACNARRLGRDLGVAPGEKEPYHNPSIQGLHRYEAMARLQDTLNLMQGGQVAGVQQAVVPPELVSQLMVRIWNDLEPRLRAATAACDVRTWNHLQPELLQVLESQALMLDAAGDQALSRELASLPTSDVLGTQLGAILTQCGVLKVASVYDTTSAAGLLAEIRALRGLLEEVPRRMRQPLGTIDRNLALLRDRLRTLLADDLRRQRLKLAELVDLLEAGLVHDRLVLRFAENPAPLLILPPHLALLRRTIQSNANRDRDFRAYQRANRLLQKAAASVTAAPPRPVQPAGLRLPEADSEAGLAWRQTVAAEAVELSRAVHDLAAAAAGARDQAGPGLPDIRLPGGLSIDDAFGEISFHTGRRELSGRLAGTLKLPGAGLEFTLRNAAFSSGGALAGELFGSLALPPSSPAVTLRIPAHEPAAFAFERGGRFRLSGGGRLRLANGAELGCFLSLDHPAYQFAASASGLRVQFAKEGLAPAGLPDASRVPASLEATALACLSRAGLVLDALQPEPAAREPSPPRLDAPAAPPRPVDTDDLVAAASTLELLLRAPGSLVPRSSPVLHNAPPGNPPDPKAVALVRQLAAQLDRSSSALRRDAEELSQLDLALAATAGRVPLAEIAALRGPRLVEVARRLGNFGTDHATALHVLKLETTRELLGAAGVSDLDTLLRPVFESTAACLRALRTNLVAWAPVPDTDPVRHAWSRGPHWNPEAARAGVLAAVRLLQNLQFVDYGDVALEDGVRTVACLLRERLLEAELETLGLDLQTGGIPTRPADQATYLSLDRLGALDGLRRLLEMASTDQAGLCDPDPRLSEAIPAVALRTRDLVVTQLHAIQDRFEDPFQGTGTTRSWEQPEAVLAACTNLFAVLTTPAALGMDRYPQTTFRLARGLPAPHHETDDPAVDATDALALYGSSLARLQALLQDEQTGYPAELRRRRMELRGALLPAHGLIASLAARFPAVSGLDPARNGIQQLARFEAGWLAEAASQPGFAGRIGQDAAALVRRVVNLVRWLDEPSVPDGRALAGSPMASDAALEQLTGQVLPALSNALAAESDTRWWIHAAVARELLDAGTLAWSEAAIPDALRASRLTSQDAATRRVAALLDAVRARQLPADLHLPGELEVQRLFGSVAFNVQTRHVQVELGGRVEFPQVRTPAGEAASFELRRLRLDSQGRFEFEAATRGPLPFGGTAFTGQLQARGDWPTRALDLHGEGEIVFDAPPVNPDSGQPFAPRLAASLDYEPIGYDAQGEPEGWRFALRTEGAFRQAFGQHLAVFGAAAGFSAGRTPDGQPLGSVTVGGSVGLIRRPERLDADPPTPGDFQFVIEGAEIAISGVAGEGGSATITRGVLHLPDGFYPAELPPELRCEGPGAPRTGPSVSIQEPLGFRYEVGGKPRLEGVLRFARIGLRVPRADFLSLVLCEASLGLDEQGLPFLDVPRAGMLLEVPWDKGVLRLQNLHLGLDGRVSGELLLAEDFDLFRSDDFRATLLGVPSLADPRNTPPGGCRGTQLRLEDVPGFNAPRLTLAGAVRVELPLAAIANTDGSRVGGTFCGGIRIDPTDGGPAVSAFVDELAFEGEFGFGSPNVRLRQARLVARNFAGILAPNSEAPFHFSVSGTLQTGPFSFGVSEAQLRYLGPERLPGFSLAALSFARDATRPLPVPLNYLPFAVDFAEFRFKNPQADIQQLLRPENLRVTVSGRLGLPTVQNAFLRGGVSGLVFEFHPDGSPIPPAIDGFDLTVSGTADLQIPMTGNLGGKLRFGGLQRALHDGPQHIYCVGELGTTMQGYKLNLLGAFTLAAPIGLCLDVSLGGAGLILSPTPFQIVGASGGFAFLTTDDPCDFTRYFVFDPAAGIYRLKQTIELPAIPLGLTWADFTRVVTDMQSRAAAFAGTFDPGSIPLPGGPRAAGSTGPGLAGAADAFGCPTDCPPPTVGLLCQPHPDRASHPDRVIFKFTSIPEAVLNADPPAGLGIRRDSFAQLGGNADAIATAAAARLVEHLGVSLPGPGDGVGPAGASFIAQQQAAALEALRAAATTVIAAALRTAPDAYGALRDALYAGMPCPDLTLALGGKVSMVGLSGFGWIEGREVSSLSGSGGVIGELHVLGIPVGEARAFIASTDANGDPNPSLCGQVTASLGPLDLGRVDVGMDCQGCVTEFLRLFPTLALAVGDPFLRESLGRLDPALVAGSPSGADLVRRVQALPPDRQLALMLGFLADVQRATPDRLPGNLGEIVRSTLAAVWDRIQPRLVLCGEVQPRLFGLPLTAGGRTAALNALTTKEGYIGEFAFSPANLCPLFPPGDEAVFSFALQMHDPYSVLLGAFDGRLNDPREVAALVREQVEYALQHQILAAQYQWHPFGLELGDAAVRFVLPDVFDHPALPGSTWRNPDTRTGEGLPSRDAVLVAAAASGRLGRAFDWRGDAEDFAAIFPPDDPHGEVLRVRSLSLRHDYFPHGGLMGGARMALPRILMVRPDDWTGLYHTAVSGTDLFQRFGAAMTLLNEYVLRTETNGTAAFYLPAPNPPVLYREDGEPLEEHQVEQLLTREPEQFTPAALMDQLRRLGANDQTLQHLYPDDLAFLRAEMTNLTLLGVPAFGTARITGRPTPVRLLDGQPLARIEFTVDDDSWLGRVTGAGFGFAADLHAPPPQSLTPWARSLLTDLERERAGGRRLAGVPASPGPGLQPHVAEPALDRFARELAAQLPRFGFTNRLPTLRVTDPHTWAGTFQDPGSGTTGTAKSGASALRAAPLLVADLELLAFSPLHDPSAPGEGPVAEARRQGGFAAQGRIDFLPERPSLAGAGQAEVAVGVTDGLPRLRGRISSLNQPTPFPGVVLRNAAAEFDNQGNPFLTARTSLGSLDFGPLFRLGAADGGNQVALAVGLGSRSLGSVIRLPRFTLELDPVRLSSERLGGHGLVLHGEAGRGTPVTITEAGWDGAISFLSGPGRHNGAGNEVVLRAPVAGTQRDVVRIAGLPDRPFTLRGAGLQGFEAELASTDLPTLTVELFPGLDLAVLPQRTFELAPTSGGGFEFRLGSDGSFHLLGRLARDFPAASHGVFAAGAEVRVDQDGAIISGTIGNASGTLRLGAVGGQITVAFSAEITLPRLCALGERVCLASSDGGDLVATVGPAGLCVNGAVLTLHDFAPGAPPLTFAMPAFCLDASRNFANVFPSSGPSLHSPGDAALSVGGFLLDALGSLRVSGGFNTRRVSVDFEALFRLGSLLTVPVRGTVGSDGLRFGTTGSLATLLGFDFAEVSLGATNALGELSGVAFSGRLPSLPPPFSTLRFAGTLPPEGAFTLEPAPRLELPSFIPGFPLTDFQPAFTYRPRAYAEAVREASPAGYWRLDDSSDIATDSRLESYSATHVPRNGEYVGNPLRMEPGVPEIAGSRAVRFDGQRTWVRLPATVPAASTEGLAVSLWFRRAIGAPPATPQTLAGQGGAWSLRLTGSAAEGTRLRCHIAGLEALDGTPAPPLASVRRLGVDDTGWHHVIALYDGSAQWLYLDGRLDAWQPVRGSASAGAGAGVRPALGALASDAGVAEFFHGWLDEVAIFAPPAGPAGILEQWLAAGHGGIRFDGTLPPGAVSDLPALAVMGVMGGDGTLVGEISSGGTATLGGLQLPEFGGTLVRSGGTGAISLRSRVALPLLDAQPFAQARGLLGGNGRFLAEAHTFETRGVFGWDFRLKRLVASGNWRTLSVQAAISGDLVLPHGLGRLELAGTLDPARHQYTLTGAAGGSLPVGSLPFAITSPPKLTDQGFEAAGSLALGTAPNAARFNTALKLTKTGEVDARFSGGSSWIDFGGDTHAQLRWSGRLAYAEGHPQLKWRGTLGLSWPDHPRSLEELPPGTRTQTRRDCWTDPLGIEHCVDTPVGMSLRTEETDLVVDTLGRTTLPATPAFRGSSSFGFRLP